MGPSREWIASSGYAREGFADLYDRFRPRPPAVLLKTLCRYARVERPALVVDLGSGTGLSTRAWAGVAEHALGIEPNAAMIAAAPPAARVEYVQAFASDTGLDDGCADIVTCSQSLHWMEPEPTLAEAARILRRGGVFAAYDYDWPPVVDPELDAAFDAYMERRGRARERRGLTHGADSWRKSDHLTRMRASGRFGYCRELVLHSEGLGDVGRIVGFARSIGLPVADADDAELERELRIDELERAARRVLGDREVPMIFGYRVRVGIK